MRWFRGVRPDGLGDLLEEDRFAPAGRGHDEAALSLAERCDEVDGAGAEGWLVDCLEQDAFLREGGLVCRTG